MLTQRGFQIIEVRFCMYYLFASFLGTGRGYREP